MNDKELADRIVALGVGSKWSETMYMPEPAPTQIIDTELFCRSWIVAGAMMEKMDGELLIWLQKYSGRTGVWIVETEKQDADARNESLPRAINEACCEALERRYE